MQWPAEMVIIYFVYGYILKCRYLEDRDSTGSNRVMRIRWLPLLCYKVLTSCRPSGKFSVHLHKKSSCPSSTHLLPTLTHAEWVN